MKRILIAGIVALGLGSTASAASLSVATDAPFYNVGDTITITMTLNVDGGELADALVSRLTWDAAIASAVGNSNQDTALTAFNGVIVANLGAGICLVGSCTVIDQLLSITPVPLDGPATLVATLALHANVAIFGLDWLDLEVEEASFRIPGLTAGDVVIVPEPGTAAMVGLGLLGLASAGRRRN